MQHSSHVHLIVMVVILMIKKLSKLLGVVLTNSLIDPALVHIYLTLLQVV